MRMMAKLLVLMMMLLSFKMLYAEEKKDSASGFWEKLRVKIEQMAPQKKLSPTTAVGGVRGAKMAVDDVYWKGEKAPQAVDADELEVFKNAMSLASAGENAKAQSAFNAFVSKNPDSPLRKDAELALAQLKATK